LGRKKSSNDEELGFSLKKIAKSSNLTVVQTPKVLLSLGK
jgi:hypothetical protein